MENYHIYVRFNFYVGYLIMSPLVTYYMGNTLVDYFDP